MTKQTLITQIVFFRFTLDGMNKNKAVESIKGYRRKSIADLKLILKADLANRA
tara:strand:+ start:328 stop:486 length:159 start_codon:yes stop_codon:yes gene_type:complete